MSYWPRNKRKKSPKSEEKQEPRESVSKRFPEAFVMAVRDTPFGARDSMFGTPDDEFASVGVGLKELARIQLQAMNVNDIEKLELYAAAGQETLKEIEKAKAHRAKEKTMDELKDIMNRIKFTLEDMKEMERPVTVTPDADTERKEKIEEEKIKRKMRKKRRKSMMKKRMERVAELKAKAIDESKRAGEEKDQVKERGSIIQATEREAQIPEADEEGKTKVMERIAETQDLEGKVAEFGTEEQETELKGINKARGLESEIADVDKDEQTVEIRESGDFKVMKKEAEKEEEGEQKEGEQQAELEKIAEAQGLESQEVEDGKEQQADELQGISDDKKAEIIAAAKDLRKITQEKGITSKRLEDGKEKQAKKLQKSMKQKERIAEVKDVFKSKGVKDDQAKKIKREEYLEAKELEMQIAGVDRSTRHEFYHMSDDELDDDYSFSSDDLDDYSWSSSSDYSFLSSDEYDYDSYDSEYIDYDKLQRELEQTYRPSSVTEKAEQRRQTTDAIANYIERCMERDEQLLQLQSWMETATTEEFPQPFMAKELGYSPYSPDLLEDTRTREIQNVIEAFQKTMGKLKGIADSLGIGEGVKEEEPVTATPEKIERARLPAPTKTKFQKVFNQEELSIPDNFNKAAKNLAKVLEEAIKCCPTRRVRVGIAEGLKQFKFMVKVLEARDEKLNSLNREILNIGGEQAKAKKQVEELRKGKKKVQVKCEKLEYLVDDQKARLNISDKKIQELNKVVQDYKRRESFGLYDESEESTSEMSSSGSSSPTFGDEAKEERRRKKKEKRRQKKAGKKRSDKHDKKMRGKTEEGATESETKAEGAVDEADIENSKLYQNLRKKYEKARDEVKIEREKLAEFEKEFEAVKNEKVKLEQEKIDHTIEIEKLIRKQEVETEELRDAIANFEIQTTKLKNEVESNEEMIQYQEERLAQYAEEIQILEEKLMGPIPDTSSSASFAQASRRGRKPSIIEPPTARQMMTKIKQQYESEIQGLKDFLSKENHRHQADSRRKEQEHKKDIQNIHKESLQVLRSINRFKDGTANLLDRESLLEEAHAMRKLPPLQLDDSPAEIRQMLAKMAILSNELLVSMELQLSKALMTKRLEVKDTSSARTIQQKELEAQSTALRKAKDVGALQATKLRNVREEMMEYEAEVFKYKLQEGEKREVLEERYKELYNDYMTLRREGITARKAERSEREKDEELHRKEALIMRNIRKEKALQRALEEQRKVITNLTSAWQLRRFGQYYITKAEQMKNLETLKAALHDDRIRKGAYELTTSLIKEAIELPKKRFIDLVQKYVRYIKMKEMEERVKRARIEENLGDKFIYMLEKRRKKQQELWDKKRKEFVKKRAEILMQLSKVLTRISKEAEVLLSQPKVLTVRAGQAQADVVTGIPTLFEAVKILKTREKAKELLAIRMSISSKTTGDISPPMGVKIDYTGQDPAWKLKDIPSHPPVIISTPRILDLDVNMTRIAAHGILSQVSSMPWNQASKKPTRAENIRFKNPSHPKILEPASANERTFFCRKKSFDAATDRHVLLVTRCSPCTQKTNIIKILIEILKYFSF